MNWKVWAAVAAALLYTFLVHSDGKVSGRLEGKLAYSQLESQLATARADATAAAITYQRQLDAETNRMTYEHSQAMAEMQRSAASDRAESDSLRSEATKLQDRLRGHPANATNTGFQLSSATKAAMVLSELFSSCSAERSELARAFDESYARGVGLERRYDALLKTVNKAP